MSVARLVAALILFGLIAGVAGMPPGRHADLVVTTWLEDAIPSVTEPGRLIVSAADPVVLILGLAAAGAVFLLWRDRVHGLACLWLASGTAGVSLLAAFSKHLIAHRAPMAVVAVPPIDAFTSAHGADVPALFLALLALLIFQGSRRPRFLWLGATVAGFGVLGLAPYYVIGDTGRHVLQMMGLYPIYGFPSGHTMRTTFLAGTALRRTPVLAVGTVAVMMASLVYLKLHWTSEVLGGLCLGWACVETAREVWHVVRREKNAAWP